MRVAMAIGAMVLCAIAMAMLIAWLSNRASVALRAAGALLARIVSIYCLIYVVALGVESAKEFKLTTICLTSPLPFDVCPLTYAYMPLSFVTFPTREIATI